jgi:hypothetical protein
MVSRLEREGLPIERIDVDQSPNLAKRFAIRLIPTFVLVINDEEVTRITGSATESQLRNLCARIPTAEAKPKPTVTARGKAPGPQPIELPRTAAGPLAASVRVRIKDRTGEDFGSGTIISSRPGRSYILTCGHIFKHWDRESKILVDIFEPGGVKSLIGAKVACNIEDDVGLIAVNNDQVLPFAKIAPPEARLLKGTPLACVGCSGGEPPTLELLKVTALNRYQGAENVECTGVPARGRSGGGLFTKDGVVVGVCMAADPKLQEGLYAGLGTIHALLAECGLSGLADGNPATPRQERPAGAEASGQLLAFDKSERDAAPARAPQPEAGLKRPRRHGDVRPDQAPEGLLWELQEALSTAPDAELVCLVRTRDGGRSEHKVVVVHNAGRDLVEFLTGGGNEALRETSLYAPVASVERANAARRRAMPNLMSPAARLPRRVGEDRDDIAGAPAPYRRARVNR